MIKIIYKQDPLSENKTIEHAETIGLWLTSKYEYMPEHVRIFHTTSNMDNAEISFANEVTPKNAYELKQLDFLPGTFIVIENPKGIPALVAAIVSIVLSVAVALLMPTPSIAQTNQNNNQSSSANNELSNRENKIRVNGRIADIYGAAHDTPDLIAVPYKVYENNVEVEHVVGCIGRGHYKINGAYDGETNIVDIAGASVEVYRPGVDIVSGEPYFSLGTEITTPPLTVQHQTSVNGQVLRPADTQSLEGTNYLHFAYPNEILRASANNTDLTTKFVSNDRVEITNASFTYNGQTYDLNGTYSVLSVADDRMTLSNPAAVNANWLKLKELSNQQTAALSPKISSIGEKWIGPFILDNVERSRVLCNFVATNGLYTVSSGGNQAAVNVTIEVEVTPVNESGAAIGNPMLKQIILKGSAKSRQTVGATLDMVTFQGRCSVRARRLTPTPAVTTVDDEVKWQALYGAYPLQSTVYEHETVFRARTYATTGALSVKSRKINFDLQRMLPTYKNGAMTTELYPTSSFADALVSMALDDKIGRRTIDEIDLENIYRTYNDVVDYFGTPLAAEFCTTIDDTNLSFEELVTNLCDAVFCTAYRQNNKLKLYFERPTDNSVMLFNFRNIIPDSYKHDLTFGVMDDYDGLIYEYTDPTDDSRINIYLPDKGAKNPKEVKSVGVRNKWQAHFNAYRLWNKLRFQRKSITFDAAPESELLVLRDRIAVADYRNGIHQSGEVVQQEGLILTLSHDVDFIAGKSYVIYLQMGDGTVDLIPVTAGSAKNKVVLGRLPNGALKLSPDDFVNTIYTVVNDDTKGSLPYLVAKREPADQFSNTITAINYDERYYLNDKDFIDVPVDDSPIYIRYDQLDINLARLYQMQRGDLPTTGEISFVVEAGALVSSSSSYRPETRMVYKFDYNNSPAKREYIVPAATELPAIDTGEFPPDLVVNLTIKGSVVGRGGDGGLPHLAYGDWEKDSDFNFTKTRRDGFQGAPGLLNRHSKLNLIIDGGTLARGGSGGGATPSGIYTGLSYGVQGIPGGAGAPFGRVMTGQPISNDSQDYRLYLESYLLVMKITDAEASVPGKGYRTQNERYGSPLSGDGGNWGERGTKSTNDGTWNWQYHGTTEGQPGPGGPAIIGVAPLTTQLINGGKILQTL
ncbi:Putative bacteriophage protein [Acinetobacter baumannii]|uniref:host specificity factor TipJ family phage tail protein n=1 Tax=Acinetobacter baumannii TaxID=470 RepID=UPI000DE7B390|nr:host specificity factor TipJ family phage tail protein [Acinetobacter baumannii]SSU95888.1 Putative bacteriophage protein [Acinetobacter baumannii]SSV56699.1 Putative bacteriophage protein [Acinetobacter baumannii]SSV60600.1 Putative bacteriophage protein [Acinetobacter baumannii]SSV87955.1 Putative bacteriophage protein [Acinetobacter baumannii]